MRPSNPTVQVTQAQMTKSKETSATSKKAVIKDRTLSSGPHEKKLADDDCCESTVDSGFLSGSISLTSSDIDVKSEKTGDRISSDSKLYGQRGVLCQEETTFVGSDRVLEAFEPDQDGDTHLHLAIIQGLPEVVFHIINLAPEPEYLNFRNDLYQTPLNLAVLTHQAKLVRSLVAAGAEVNIRDRRGNTGLHLASSCGDVECVRQLTIPLCSTEAQPSRTFQALPQNLDLKNYDGMSSMHLATLGGFANIVHHLAMYGADVNVMDGKSGWTPLHYSVHALNYEMTKFLLEKCKADPRVQNYKKRTPLNLLLSSYSSKHKNTYRRVQAMQDLLRRYDSTRSSSSDDDSDSDVSIVSSG